MRKEVGGGEFELTLEDEGAELLPVDTTKHPRRSMRAGFDDCAYEHGRVRREDPVSN